MFNEKKESPSPVGERNTIAKNTSLVGDIKSDGDFRVDGKIVLRSTVQSRRTHKREPALEGRL